MRVIALAALGLALAAAANAETFTDPSGRVQFEQPAGWDTYSPHGSANPDVTLLISGSATQECHHYVVNRANNASASADTMRRSLRNPIGEAGWSQTIAGFRTLFPTGQSTVANARVDETGFWPIQRAELTADGKPVHGALQARPGLELWTFCLSVEGADNPALFERVIRSVGTTQDAALRASAEAAEAARAPQAPADND